MATETLPARHLATFILFREQDMSIHVTVADARGVREELGDSGAPLHLCAMNALRAAVELRPEQPRPTEAGRYPKITAMWAECDPTHPSDCECHDCWIAKENRT